jgi:hypothetical protein
LDHLKLDYPPLTGETLRRIRDAVGETALILDARSRETFGKDSTELSYLPEAVVEATSAEQVE